MAWEIISEISLSNRAHQYLVHLDPSDDPIYSLPNVAEILIPTDRRGYGSRNYYPVFVWNQVRDSSAKSLGQPRIHPIGAPWLYLLK